MTRVATIPSTMRRFSSSARAALLSCFPVAGVLLALGAARATVTQVDGTIIPETGRMQGELDAQGEPLHAILDAAELPDVFLPNTTAPVLFHKVDVADPPGFRNSFGWYNIGDEVLTPAGRAANLHPIIGCGVPMEENPADPSRTHTGDPTMYVQDAFGGETAAVDFGAELAAGRYKGGFIGFYLVTPEDSPSSVNCGDFKLDADGDSQFGYIYFTQKDLNDDGDFVHHLVYTSQLVADRFFFGFEDLFRGGDNDFQDMLVRVDGLTPPCLPSAEICDGLDNNCSGLIDADDPELTGTGDPCVCDGMDMPCVGGPRQGECRAGETVCVGGELHCMSIVDPSPEICDGLDNNCNGQIDESTTDSGIPCGSAIGECTPGATVCVGGVLECHGAGLGGPEHCNGKDDDCDGVIDNDPIDAGGSCGSSVGVCTPGNFVCVDGALECQGANHGGPELCNGLDDDCDGIADNNPIDVGLPCGTTDEGECQLGETICVGGVIACAGELGPQPERCNGLDDDCDGVPDNDPIDVGTPCGSGIGVCQPGVLICTDMGPECDGAVTGAPEVCNGLDDDCNGIIDDDPEGVGEPCGTDEGVCEMGVTACINGQMQCVGGYEGTTETCNGLDDDCNGIIDDGDLCEGGLCIDGECAPPCTADEFPCPAGRVCEDDFCVPDPCFGVTCPPGSMGERTVCVAGECVPSCDAVTCPDETVCRPSDGTCVPNDCHHLPLCEGDEVCSEEGECIVDPCIGIECPAGQACHLGECFTPEVPDAGPPRTHVVAAGGGGCSGCSGGDSSGGPALALLIVAITLALRRRRRRRLAAIALAALLATTTGCNVNPFCLDCEPAGPGIDGGALPPDATPDASADAAPDCDGETDIDYSRDFYNCGACGQSCYLEGTRTACEDGACIIRGCFPGRVDLNGDITGPFEDSDGCEYACFVSNGGVSACDGLDNNCNGIVDEGFDFDNDDDNCGICGRVCSAFMASSRCVAGECYYDPATDCAPGFIDLDGDPANGCEYACTPTNGGVEICDLRDNDCNGVVDDGFDLDSDVLHCGQCNRTCAFPNATARCTNGTCWFDPAVDCLPGFHDINGNQLDGCEYECHPTNGGVEICDLVDNDCNGIVDDMPVDAGGACNNAPGGVAAGQCTDTGALVCSAGALICVGAPVPQLEVCDGVDNNCNGQVDEGVTRGCYTGPDGTAGVGVCKTGIQACIGGEFAGPCVGEVTPAPAELCNGLDDDCDGVTDEGPGGGALTQACYDGPPGTDGMGTCLAGVQTCAFGAWGTCAGQVTPSTQYCGDGLDTSCNGLDDEGEGCLAIEMAEVRLDAPGGPVGSDPGQHHSFDLALAAGGDPLGSRVYAVWSDLTAGHADVFFRRSLDGGATWGTIVNVTAALDNAAVKPILVVAPGATDRLFIVYQSVHSGLRRIRVQTSMDGGVSWTAASNSLDETSHDAFNHHAAVSADGLSLAVVWERLNVGTLQRTIRSRVLTDGGTTLQTRRRIDNGGAAAVAGRPRVAVTASGRLAFVWRERRDGSTFDVFATYSDSASATIPAGHESRLDGDGDDERASDLPQLLAAGDNLYVVWQDISTQPGGGADVIFTRSLDGGASWAAERILDDPDGEVSASFTPTLAIDPREPANDDDRIYVAWEDRRQGTQIFTTTSSDSGATFSPAVRATSSGGNPATGVTRAPRLAHLGGDSAAVAYLHDQGTGVEAVFVSTSIDAGATWQLTHTRANLGTGKAQSPAIAPGSGGGLALGAVVGWIDFRSGSGVHGDPYTRRTGR